MAERTIWTRGITPSDRGKRITVDGHDYLLRDVQHFEGSTVLTVVTSLELGHRVEVTIHE